MLEATIKAVTCLAAFAAVTSIGGAGMAQTTICPDKPDGYTDAAVLVQCIEFLKQQVIPSGAVVAFARPGGCPAEGWTPFAEASGKVILGVGEGVLNIKESQDSAVQAEIELTERKYLAEAGAEEHALAMNEMPRHEHIFIRPEHASGVARGDESSNWSLENVEQASTAGVGGPEGANSGTAAPTTTCRPSSPSISA